MFYLFSRMFSDAKLASVCWLESCRLSLLGRRRLAMKVSECLKLFPLQKRTHVRLSLLRKLETDDGLGFSH